MISRKRKGGLTAVFSLLTALCAIAVFTTAGRGSGLDSLFIDQWVAATGYVAGYFAEARSDDDALLTVETWTGGANDSAWTSNGNWSGIGGAGADDDLVFPASASRKTNVNDFPANTRFHSITISGNDYAISGNQIHLNGGITANQTAVIGNHPTFSPNIVMDIDQSITTTSRTLNLNGTINANLNTITFTGGGSTIVNGAITGGAISKIGTGTAVINGNSAPTIATLQDGQLAVNGTIGKVQMSGGTLLGTGSVGEISANLINAGGTINPGSGGTTTGILTATGVVGLSAPVNVQVDLNGGTVGTQYDRLVCSGGNVLLGGSNLKINLGFTPAVGQQFSIINTSGPGNVVLGQFAQGTAIVSGNTLFSISYNATSVILIAQGPLTSLTWDGGGATNNWSEGANWNPNVPPIDGFDLVFPAGVPADSQNQQNDIAGLNLSSIIINATGYTISGNAFTVSAGISQTGSGGASTINAPATLAASQTISANSANLAIGQLDLNGFTLTASSSSAILALQGTISGNGTINKTGAGVAMLSAVNTFTGPVNVNQGTLTVTTGGALGAVGASNGTVVASGARLSLANNSSHSESLTLNGNASGGALMFEVSCDANCVANGPITLASNASVLSAGTGFIGASIGESGGARTLTKYGTGLLRLAGSNTYSGTTFVNEGPLQAERPTSITGDLVVGDGIGGANADIALVPSAQAIHSVTVNDSGLLDGTSATNAHIGALSGTGNVAIGFNSTLTIGENPINTTFSGVISGSGSFTKTGSGTLTLTGVNTFNGQALLSDGGLTVNGAFPAAIGNRSGKLAGTGTIGNVTNIAPGITLISPGSTFNLTPGIMNVTNDLSTDPDRTLVVDIGGTTAGTQYDRILVGGDTSLNGANLSGNLLNGFIPNPGQQFTILQSTLPITGRFAQGNSLAIGGRPFSITYNPNSIVLTALRGLTPADFDGDGKSDISIFRPSNGQWWLQRSTLGTVTHTFGTSTDKLVPGDYTGDGATDVAIFRPGTGEWFVLRSEDFTYFSFPFGNSTDVPAPGDYDGDQKTDAAVFRPSTATWFIQNSGGGTTITTFGASTDLAVPADYDGDAKTDIAIYRPSNGQWWLKRSSLGVIAVTFGTTTDKCVPGDYTGDKQADIAIWRPSTGEWFIRRSENASFFSFPFGTGTDTPVPGDYDGDGKFDAAVFRPSNTTWFIQQTGGGGTLSQSFGSPTDIPVPSAFVR